MGVSSFYVIIYGNINDLVMFILLHIASMISKPTWVTGMCGTSGCWRYEVHAGPMLTLLTSLAQSHWLLIDAFTIFPRESAPLEAQIFRANLGDMNY